MNAGELVLDPDQPIIDAHHHLYIRPDIRYLPQDFLSDVQSGHNIRATVFVQARGFYREQGPETYQPIGETEFAASVAKKCEDVAGPKLCAAIVGYADLLLGESVRPVLEAHMAAGKSHFRGLRHILAWDADPQLLNPAYSTGEDMMATTAFKGGFAQLATLGLSFDAWLLFPQIPQLVALARRFPETQIVLNHCGGVLGIGRYADSRQETFELWRKNMAELASCPNVCVKLGGLGMALSGLGFDRSLRETSSEELASAWRPWIQTCIELFGAKRCMFESNFPADKPSYSYRNGWNAMKILARGLSTTERHAAFYGSAAQFYRLDQQLDADFRNTVVE